MLIIQLMLALELIVKPCLGQMSKTIEASIMCSVDGILAQMGFSGAFNGKIYSSRYASVHNCVYYNHKDENTVLFSIPNYNCGTLVEKDELNRIARIENEVYVQFEKETQNADDRRYLFVCDRGNKSNNINENRRKETLHPGQTIIVETIIPTRLSATNENYFESYGEGGKSGKKFQADGLSIPRVWLEVRDGSETAKSQNNSKKATSKLGDPLILVVSGRSNRNDSSYDIFAHSCFATDGSGSNRIDLTDANGCSMKLSLLEKMQRSKNQAGLITYSLPFKAFKFPTTNDVYFSCSVDVCSSCNFTDICWNKKSRKIRRTSRNAQSNTDFKPEFDPEVRSVYDSLKVFDFVDLPQIIDQTERYDSRNYNSVNIECLTKGYVIILSTVVSFLITSLAVTIAWNIVLRRRRRKE